MNRRRIAADLAPAAWPAFDANALPKKQRSTFKARQQAVELYAANTAVAEIEKHTGVDRRQDGHHDHRDQNVACGLDGHPLDAHDVAFQHRLFGSDCLQRQAR